MLGRYFASATVAGLLVSTTIAQDLTPSSHLNEMCFPDDASGVPDLAFPCNVWNLILYECMYGVEQGEDFFRRGTDSNLNLQSNETQRICGCQSQFFEYWSGCKACWSAHGGPEYEGPGSKCEQDVEQISSSYCAATNTPSIGLYEAVSVDQGVCTVTKTASDTLAGSTAVSLYYTPAITGPAATQVEDVTNNAGSTTISVVTSDGQIVATAGQGSATTSTSTSSSSTSSGGAVKTEGAAAIGVLGVAAVFAAL